MKVKQPKVISGIFTKKCIFIFEADNTCVTSSELSDFAAAVIEAYDSGVIATSETSSSSNWEYGPSVFFSTTVITTIGISLFLTTGYYFFLLSISRFLFLSISRFLFAHPSQSDKVSFCDRFSSGARQSFVR
jgi:hypothetical protein